MLFDTLEFMIFFPVVCAAYFALPYRWRWALLLLASYYFYACWNPAYLGLIVLSTAVDYVAGLIMGRTKRRRVRVACLIGSLVCNLGILFTFKYLDFFNASVQAASAYLGIEYEAQKLDMLLPVGISFYTFQTLSYTIEVFKGTHEPERNLGRFALYVAFFPQLVAGPIERSARLLPQFLKKNDFDYARAVFGLRLVLWGLFKKMVVADRLSLIVDHIYDSPDSISGPILVIGTVAFAFQIYCDFSGYSDIAIGTARILGYDLMCNFNRPYAARSIGDFWQRWHISLSTWFRDYVYIPLGGSKVAASRYYANIFIVFAASGLWHGANWTFLVWGMLHAVYYMFSRLTKGLRSRMADTIGLTRFPRIHKGIQVGVTFVLVCIGWVFFRAPSVASACDILVGMTVGWKALLSPQGLPAILKESGASNTELLVTFASVVVLLSFEAFQDKGRPSRLLAAPYRPLRWAVYAALALAMLNFGVYHEVPFIYFQF